MYSIKKICHTLYIIKYKPTLRHLGTKSWPQSLPEGTFFGSPLLRVARFPALPYAVNNARFPALRECRWARKSYRGWWWIESDTPYTHIYIYMQLIYGLQLTSPFFLWIVFGMILGWISGHSYSWTASKNSRWLGGLTLCMAGTTAWCLFLGFPSFWTWLSFNRNEKRLNKSQDVTLTSLCQIFWHRATRCGDCTTDPREWLNGGFNIRASMKKHGKLCN